MKMFRILIFMALALTFGFKARAGEFVTTAATLTATTGTVTMTESWDDSVRVPAIKIITLNCTANTSGNVTGCVIPARYGQIDQVIVDPVNYPTDDWDATLTINGLDVFCGLGANHDTTVTESFAPKIGNGTGVYGATSAGAYSPTCLSGASTLALSGLGSTKNVIIKLVIKP